MTINNIVNSVVQQTFANVVVELSLFASDTLFAEKMEIAFGNNADVSEFQNEWLNGTLKEFPDIEIRSRVEINGANGAFSTDTGKIYVAQELIDENTNHQQVITSTLLEEYGHYVDSEVNVIDSPGDEGYIFARLVQGETISDSALGVLKAENDTTTVTLDGQIIEIEQAADDISLVSRLSGDYQIDALLNAHTPALASKWANETITYSFFDGGFYYGNESNVGEVTEQVKSNIRNILESRIEPYLNVDFVEVSDAGNNYGQIRVLMSDGPNYAYAYGPSDNDLGGDIHLRNNQNWGTGPGTHEFSTLIHETLHALGLKHPGDYNGGLEPGPFLPANEDNGLNTIMSYYAAGQRDNPNTEIKENQLPISSGLMPYDVKALGYLYGFSTVNSDPLIGSSPIEDSLINGNNLGPNQQLSSQSDDKLVSGNGLHQLVMQNDGNLVLYQNEFVPVWASNTMGSGADYAIMQADGNFVLYDGSQAVWASGTSGNQGSVLGLQDDGNLVIYNGQAQAIWSSGTNI
jgi:hypothetical protein